MINENGNGDLNEELPDEHEVIQHSIRDTRGKQQQVKPGQDKQLQEKQQQEKQRQDSQKRNTASIDKSASPSNSRPGRK